MEFLGDYAVEIFALFITAFSAIVIKLFQKWVASVVTNIRDKAESKDVKDLIQKVDELVELGELQALLNMQNRVVSDEVKMKYKETLDRHKVKDKSLADVKEEIEKGLKI